MKVATDAKKKQGPGNADGKGAAAIREPLPGPVGERLREHRSDAGMSLRELARQVGVSPSLISQIEHGKATPSVATLYSIVSILDVSLDELFFDTPRGAPAPVAPAEAERYLDTHIRALLAGFKAPDRYELRDELPKTATGKVRKFVLRDEAR